MHQLPKRRTTSARTALSITTALSLVVASFAIVAPAQAAVGDTYRWYAGQGQTGTALTIAGVSGTYTPRAYALEKQGTSQDVPLSYSIDFSGTVPTGQTSYSQVDWSTALTAGAQANRGPIEWLLKNSYPSVTNFVDLGNRVSAVDPYLGTPALTQAKVLAATQAAIWYYSDGKGLNTTRSADIRAAASASSSEGLPVSNLADVIPATGWRSGANGASTVDFTLNSAVQLSGLAITSLEGGSAQSAPSTVKLWRVNAVGAPTAITGATKSTVFAGGAASTVSWTFTGSSYTAGDTYRLEFTPAGGAGHPVEVGAVRFATSNAEFANDAQVTRVFQYLVNAAAGQQPTSGAAPTLDLVSDGDRTAFAIEPGALFGPFTVSGSTAATLSLSGADAAAAQIVDITGAALTGAALTGAQASGTQFWIKPTSAVALPGSVTLKAQGATVTTTVVNGATGLQSGAARQSLAVLSSSTQSTNDELALSWSIDQNSPGTFDELGGATERTYKFFLPGVQSATLENLWWTDGTRTVTDLIGLQGQGNASASVYSSSFNDGLTIPPSNSNYTEGDWTGDNAAELTWVLQHSYPELSTSAFTDLVRGAGYNPGSGNIKNYSAIAGAQAAVWHFTDGRELDTHRYSSPTGVVASGSTPADAVLDTDTATGWRADAAGTAYLDFTFSVPVEIRSYAVQSLAGGAQGNTPAAWKLQRLSGGSWTDVSTSSATGAFTGGASTSVSRNLGGSSTVGGYTQYRLVFPGAADSALPVEIAGVTFDGFGVVGGELLQSRNTAQVIAAYEYLVAGAAANSAGIIPAAPTVSLAGETAFEREATTDLVGPFTVTSSSSVKVTLDGAADARLLATATGTPEESLILASGDQFWVYPGADAASQPTIHVAGSALNWVSARAITSPDLPSFTQLGVDSETATASLALAVTLAPTPEVSVGQLSARIGDTITVSGAGYRAGETVELQLHSEIIVLGTSLVADDGTFSEEVTIPAEAEVTDHEVVALGLSSLRSASVPLEVLAARVIVVVPPVVVPPVVVPPVVLPPVVLPPVVLPPVVVPPVIPPVIVDPPVVVPPVVTPPVGAAPSVAVPTKVIPNLGAGDSSQLIAGAGLLVALGLMVLAGAAVVRRRGTTESAPYSE